MTGGDERVGRPTVAPDLLTVVFAIAAGLGVMLLIKWATTPFGPGLFGDGAGYLSGAESLVHAGRLRVIGAPYWSADSTMFMGQWPPGFPVVVAAPLSMGLGPLSAVSLVQMVSAAGTLVLTTMLVGRNLGPASGGAAAIAVIATPAVLGTQLNVVSEPLYILGIVLMLWAMTAWADRPIIAGLVGAGLVMVRYLGLAAVGAAGLWAFLRPGTSGQRLRRASLAVLPGIATYAAWMMVVRRNGGATRAMIVDHHILGLVRRLAGATGAWLAPWDQGPPWIHLGAKVAIVGLWIVACVLARRSTAGQQSTSSAPSEPNAGRLAASESLMAAAGLLTVCHVAMLFTAQLLDSSVAFSTRVLAPVHYLLTLLAITALGVIWQRGRGAARLAAGSAAAIWLVGSASGASHLVTQSRAVGLDHAAVEERNSPMIAWLRADAAALPIYTNEPAKIYYRLHRPSRELPWIVTPDTLRLLDQILRERPGYVVWFAAGKAKPYVPASLISEAISPEKLASGLPLSVSALFPDGIVWRPDSSRERISVPAR